MEFIIAIIFVAVGCALAKLMLVIYKIDKSEHHLWMLSWVTVLVLLMRDK